MFKRFFLFLLLLLTCCGENKNSNTLIVGISPDYPPFAFKKGDQYIGYDIDVMNAIGQKLNKKIQYKEMDFCALISSLLSGQIDLVISSVTPTEARLKKVDFSKTYYTAKNCLVYHKQRHRFDTVYTMKNKTIGIALGFTQESLAQELQKQFPFEVKTYNVAFQLIEEIKIGRIDAALIGLPQGLAFIKHNNNLTYFTLPDEYAEGGYAIAFPKKSPLKEKINNVIVEMEKENYFQSLEEKWFGDTPNGT